jgi:hypothetical protein
VEDEQQQGQRKVTLTPGQRAARRAASHRMYRRRKEAGLCVRCGKGRDTGARAAGWADCTPCRVKMRAASEASRRRGRMKTWRGAQTDGAPTPSGRNAPRTGAVKQLTVYLDFETRDALREILAEDEKRNPGVAVLGYRAARLVRVAIARWETRACPKRRRRLMNEPGLRIRVWLDPGQLSTVERQAKFHGISMAEAVRCMILANRPHTMPVTGGERTWHRAMREY